LNEQAPAPKKSLGQHWLHDQSVCRRITQLSAAAPNQPILEIGPGAGALTQVLLETGARVTALETDLGAISFLNEKFEAEIESGQLRIIEGDGRFFELPSPATIPWTVVSNLPYNVGTIIFLNLLNQAEKIERMVLMFQAEVSQRILAEHGSKNHGFLSVLTSLEWDKRRGLKVRPGAFKPPPRVQSEVIVLEQAAPGRGWANPRDEFRKFVDICFRNRRKMLRNVLTRNGYTDEQVRAGFSTCKLTDKTRAEAIPAILFPELFHALQEHETLQIETKG